MRVALFVPEAHFERLWTMAMGGVLKRASIWMTKPHYQSAYVTSLQFSSHPEEEEEEGNGEGPPTPG